MTAGKSAFPSRTMFRRHRRPLDESEGRLWAPKPTWTGEPLDPFDRLERHWYRGPARDDGGRPKRPTEFELAQFEARHSVTLPADFREYLLKLNGVEEDPDLFRFWPLQELRPVDVPNFTVRERNKFFFFADYLIESHYYAIYLGDDPQLQNWVVIPCMPKQPFVATTFTGFIELYLQDAPAIFGHS